MTWIKNRVKSIFLIITVAFVLLPVSFAHALVDLISSPNGSVIMQRNSQNGTYTIRVIADPHQNAQVSALEANLTYDNTVFSVISINDQINSNSGAIWETSVVNAAYQVSGNRTTVKYLKASTNGDNWNLLASGGIKILYTLTVQVKNNAPLGNTFLLFDSNFAKVQDATTGNVTGILKAVTINIALDSTAPVSSITNGILGNYYKTAQSVNLGTNEQGHTAQIHYTLDDTDPRNSGTVVTGGDPIIGIGISSVVNGMKVTTLNFYANDLPVGAPNNVEAVNHTEVYHIDTQLPTINILAHDSGPVGAGYTVRVTFNVNDNSGLLAGNPTVSLGGQNYIRVSGSGIGTYVYTRTITGSESNGNLTIAVTDLAGNTNSLLLNNAVVIDINAPNFVITPVPNPVTVNHRVTINITASKTLIANPWVTLAGVSANFISQVGNNYVFTATATANNWLANLPWVVAGPDTYTPTINVLRPSANATHVNPSSAVYLEFTDIGSSGININSLQVTVNAGTVQTAIRNGNFQSGFNGTQVLSGGIFRVTVNHTVNFTPQTTVTVNLSLKDVSGNTLTSTYHFLVQQVIPTITSINAQYTAVHSYQTRVNLIWTSVGSSPNTIYQLKYIQGNSIVYTGTGLNFSHLNLPDKVTASYVVRAISDGVTGSYSVTASVMLPDAHVDSPPTQNGYTFVPQTPGHTWSPTADAILYRDYSNHSTTMAAMVVKGASMGAGFDFNAIDFSTIVITLNARGLPILSVPSTSDFGAFINGQFASGNIKQVPLRFGGLMQKGAIITVDLFNGQGTVPITQYGGGQRSGLPVAYQGRLSGFYYSPTQNVYYFAVNRFSQYGIATISTVNFTIANTAVAPSAIVKVPIRVRDSNGMGVENAPVTLNIFSGGGNILTAIPATTNAAGYVTFNYQAPGTAQTVVLRANVDGVFSNPNLTLTVTATGPDITAPQVSSLAPANAATKVAESSSITFTLSDSQSGVKLSSVYLTINGSAHVTPSMTGPISQVAVSYKPPVSFTVGATINVVIYASDVSGNAMNYPFSFKVINLDDWNITTPLAVPTIFDPYTQSTDLIYHLNQSEDVLLHIYDLAGNRIYERYFLAGNNGARAGNNRVPWTGRDDLNQIQSNGVYFFYVVRVSDKRVLGRGKAVISKGH